MKIVVMASGRGSNFEAIYSAVKKGALDAEIVAVVSDRADAPVVAKAAELDIPNVAVLERKGFVGRKEYDDALSSLVSGFKPDIVALAGFMRILGAGFIRKFSGRIINIHPALLPSFPGLDAQKQALEYGVKVTGCTVHFVDEGTDTGPIILQEAVPVLEGDDVDSLSRRILEHEHSLYIKALRLLAQGRLLMDGRRVIISGDGVL